MQKKRSNLRRSKSVAFGSKEKKRLIQLGLCICLFLIVFLGRGSEVMEKRGTGEKLLQIIREDTDFVGAFSVLGESISHGDSVWNGFEVFAMKLFGVKEEKVLPDPVLVYDGPAALNAAQRISLGTTEASMLRIFGVESSDVLSETAPEEEAVDTEATQSQELELMVPEPEEPNVSEIPVYDGPALPANATMEYYDLGLDETASPVLGEISSEYGYRVHPLTGEYSFHAGVDIAADYGTPIAAFSAGTVEFIGESDAYGLYVQLDHGNGVKSFYCHCSELLLGKGKQVSQGQTIALVGDTGDTTGSHLHLELKKDGTLLNPVYYIESIN